MRMLIKACNAGDVGAQGACAHAESGSNNGHGGRGIGLMAAGRWCRLVVRTDCTRARRLVVQRQHFLTVCVAQQDAIMQGLGDRQAGLRQD